MNTECWAKEMRNTQREAGTQRDEKQRERERLAYREAGKMKDGRKNEIFFLPVKQIAGVGSVWRPQRIKP